MRIWRRKSTGVLVEAEQVTYDNVDRIANWTGAQIIEERDPISGTRTEGLNVMTNMGRKRASSGMYVVKSGLDFYVVGRAAFESEYAIERDEPRPASRAPDEIDTPLPLTQDPFEGLTKFQGPV